MQDILTRENPTELWVVISESALDWPVGGSGVMHGQMRKLLEATELPNVTIRVLPRSVGAHMALDGSFKVITVSEGDVLYMEACGGGRTTMDAAEVQERRLRYDRIGADALSRDQSSDMIRQAMERYS